MTTHITFDESLRLLIREKLASGGLERNGLHGVPGGAGKGQICVACGTTIGTSQFVTEGISSGTARPSSSTWCVSLSGMQSET